MGEPLPKQVLDTAVDPAAIEQQTFDHERRGFDQRQVHAYLKAVANSLQDAQQREAEIRTRLGRAVRRAEAAEQALREVPSTDPAELNRQVGDDVTSVLDAARATAEQRLSTAHKSAEKLIANAKAEATKLRAAADAVLDERRSEAEVVVADLIGEGQAEARTIRDQGRADAESMRTKAADRVQHARDEGDALIREAEEARAQILEDMERRRRQARAQVERLRVGRDRLLRSYEVVRRTLEETTVELKSSLQEAKVRGDGAARAVSAEPLASRQQLEAEILEAKTIGLINISEPKSGPASRDSVLRSPALPRRLDPPPSSPAPSRPRVSEAMKKSAAADQPKAPAFAPELTASPKTGDGDDTEAFDPIAAMIDAAESKKAQASASANAVDKGLDAELSQLEDADLNVIELADEIEAVRAVPLEAEEDPAALGLFAALRAQRTKPRKNSKKMPPEKPVASELSATNEPAENDPSAKTDPTKNEPSATNEPAENEPSATNEPAENDPSAKTDPTKNEPAEPPSAGEPVTDAAEAPGIEAQRDAVIADAAKQLEKRLKRALADEQNELLAGIRAAKKKNVGLTTIVGDVDSHVNRYVVAINEVAAVTYGAGAALIDAEPLEGHLPAGAVEELLASDVVLPIRERLESLDGLDVAAADMHVDPVRAFYRQRKNDHLGFAASRLANLLCVAGVCDALPEESELPWTAVAK